MKIKTSLFWWKWTLRFAILTTLLFGIMFCTAQYFSILLQHSISASIGLVVLSFLTAVSLNCLLVALAMAIPEIQFKSNEPIPDDTKQAEP